MKVALVSRWTSRSGAGVFRSEQQLALSLQDLGVQVGKFGWDDSWSSRDRAQWGNAEVHAQEYSSGLRRLLNATSLTRKLIHYKPDVVHLHGLWTEASASSYLATRVLSCPLIISPHGMLDGPRLAYKPIRKKFALASYEGAVLKAADVLHVLTAAERRSVHDLMPAKRTVIIPNGVHPVANPRRLHAPRENSIKTLIFVGRIAELKGVRELVLAWAQTRSAPGAFSWRMKIIGYGDPPSFERDVISLVQKLGLEDSIEFCGPLYEDELDSAYRAADAFVLPSHSEGFPMGVLEAWSYALPVIVTEQCNVSIGIDRGAGILTRPEVTTLASALSVLFSMSEQTRTTMGHRGYELVSEEFSWARIASSFVSTYKEAIGSAT